MRRASVVSGLAVVTLLLAGSATAHVGSPDTFFAGAAGPYPVRVTIRPPGVVPGLAEISVRVESKGIRRVTIRPVRYDAGPAGAPAPDVATPVTGQPGLYSGALWLMSDGAYAIEISVEGGSGTGRTSVPIASLPTRVLPMGAGLFFLVLASAVFLVAGGLAIVFAAASESTLPPGEKPGSARRRAATVTTIAAGAVFLLLLFGELAWSSRVRRSSEREVFRPYRTTAQVRAEGTRRVLRLSIDDPAWKGARWRPLVLDHGKLVHLFAMREPALDAFAHLHPAAVSDRAFEAPFPSLPAGTYSIFADVTDETGLSQTLVARADVPEADAGAVVPPLRSLPADPDDSWRISAPLPPVVRQPLVSDLGGGLSMTWASATDPILAGRELTLRFLVRDSGGRPAALEPYMGMLAHAAVVRDDGSVFVHLHPMGTVSMASLERLAGRNRSDPFESHGTMNHASDPGGEVSFPYAFPKPGPYRLWVQVRRGGEVRTGVFDVLVR